MGSQSLISSFLTKTAEYQNFTLEDTIHHAKEVDSWRAPRELQEKFPYYLAGYDFKDQPVWVAEVGKYNIKEQVLKGHDAAHNLTLYLFQGVHRIIKSMMLKDTPTKEIRKVFFIGDCEGLDLNQATHLPTVSYALNIIRKYTDFVSLITGHVVGINVNYVATLAFESLHPALGNAFESIELHGSDKAKWKTVLQKWLPAKAIPTWYGGSKEFKPIKVYG
ncbi:unnamed protein product [Allacma fusca]|uniref:CRAL-TRIO domain-containing protein n=1 Tax=Allacma fusca TaxID=39272 RepID=A0A8J2NSF7_9HEXA|nr:unnamed protein product [Allacma fusca]